MGTLRTLLAISVLITHSDVIFGIRLLNGDMAITCFYIISGFLMALILDRKYSDLRLFYFNRLLRIYPPYFAALVFSAAIMLAIETPYHDPAAIFARMADAGEWAGLAWAALSNLTLIGIDWLRYAGIADNGGLIFPRLGDEGGNASNMLFVPQGWTLALELQYYLLVPFIVQLRTRWLAGLAFAFLLARPLTTAILHRNGIPFDPASFFPLQIQYFLLGTLGYRAYVWWQQSALPPLRKQQMEQAALAFAFLLVFAGLPALRLIENRIPNAVDLFYLAFAVTVPFMFAISRNWQWDKWAGEFSYPIYLFHFAVVVLLDPLDPAPWQGEAVLAVTLAVCAVYIFAIDRPLQRRRARLARLDPQAARQDTLPTMVPDAWRDGSAGKTAN